MIRADALGMEATTTTSYPTAAIASYARWGSLEDGCDGWVFWTPRLTAEPCPVRAWERGPLVDAVPHVAEILATEGCLAVVFVEHPGNRDWIYIHTRRGGRWRKRNGIEVRALMTLLCPKMDGALQLDSLRPIRRT